jgi:protein-S-isoprenylcysteine O-methyltransferase Ste14
MKKSFHCAIATIFTVGIFVGSGIILNPSIVFDFQIWVVIISLVVMLNSQPAMRKEDLFNPDDKFSMLGILVMAVVVYNISILEWAMKANHNFFFGILSILSFMMIWGGLGFRIYAIKKLSIYFSNAATIQVEHQLYEEGIYGKIRHPSYIGAIFTMIGTLIWLETWNTFVICLGLLFIAYWHRITQEEKLLTKYFGEKYNQYRQKTGYLLPKIRITFKVKKKIIEIIDEKVRLRS